MKKIILNVFIIFFTALIIQNSSVYAAGTQGQQSQGNSINGSFVGEAFSATKEFLQEDLPEDDVGILTDSLLFFVKDAIQGINRILIIALAGIGAIAISISGIKYMRAISSPSEAAEAQKMLKTTLRGLGYGFGAFIIWEVAMGVVRLIIDSLATT